MRLAQTRLQKGQKIVKDVGIPARTDLARGIALPGKPHPVALLILRGGDLCARLHLAGVERRVDIDQLHRLVGQRL